MAELPERLFHYSLRRIRRLISDLRRTRRTYRIPAEAILFVGVTLLIGLAAMNTGAQLLYLVFGMLLAFWILSDFLATSSMNGLRVDRRTPPVVAAREPVDVEIRIRNTKRLLGSFSLRVTDILEGGERIGAAFFMRLHPRQEASARYQCVFPRRGVYRFDRLQLSTRFPFGLIERTVRRAETAEITVIPPTINVGRGFEHARALIGEVEVHHKGIGTSLYGIRNYTPGESARDIHWKLSARRAQLMAREYETEERRRASIILDNRFPPDRGGDRRDQLERGIILAGSYVAFFASRGHQVELLTASGHVAFGTGSQHVTRCLRVLAGLDFEDGNAEEPLRRTTEPECVRIAIQMNSDHPLPPQSVSFHIDEFRGELDAVLAPVSDGREADGGRSLADVWEARPA